jgi:hypothetical protein
MPWFRISQFEGSGGTNSDLPAHALPPEVFTSSQNVRFIDGALEKAGGMAARFGTPPIAPSFLLPTQDNAGDRRLFFANATTIYSYISGSFTNVSRTSGGAYAAGSNNAWTGGILHGVPFLNDGASIPQAWDIGTSKFLNMPNWVSTYRCKALRAFKNYLVALNITDGASVYPHNVLWSHPADPGAVPGTGGWDIADPTKDAGMAPLSDTPGHLVDGLALADSFVVYKESATYLMQFIGAPNIFKFRPILRESGVLSRNCIAEVMGKHIVLTTDDVIVFDGNTSQSIISRKLRRNLFAAISIADYEKSFVVALPTLREVWFCISTSEGSPPNRAYVWNWQSNDWTVRELPFTQSITWGFAPDEAGDNWDGDSNTWNSDGEGWSSISLRGKTGLVAATNDTNIYTLGVGETLNGVSFTASARHESFDFATKQSPEHGDVLKHISKIRPRVLADNATVLYFRIGTQMDLNDNITWTAPMPYTVGTTTELCLGVNGRYISWEVYSTCDCTWRLEAIELLVQAGGRF